ncbi:MAG: hypothetical protein OXB93_00400 [Cytophagales bacterium]|nr:hypothetical protein [Cytophagales bacterium]
MSLHSAFRFIFFFCGTYGLAVNLMAQASSEEQILLIDEIGVQYEILWAVDSTYNYNFSEAEKRYRWFKQKYPTHPLPYFLLSLNELWKIFPNYQKGISDQALEVYVDSTIYLGKRLYKIPNRSLEGAFFLASGYALKGRRHGLRAEWAQAILSLKEALDYFRKCESYNYMSNELLLGTALYNYYMIWLPKRYPRLRFLSFLFEKGDKYLGLNQLKKVTEDALFVRTEAQYFLALIMEEEGEIQEALILSQYLSEKYPKNAQFSVLHMRLLYRNGYHEDSRKLAQHIYQEAQHQKSGFGANQARYAAFLLGILSIRLEQDSIQAKSYYEKTWQYAQETHKQSKGYSLHALWFLAVWDEKRGDLQAAEEKYKILEKWAEDNEPMKKKLRERRSKRKNSRVEIFGFSLF